MTAGHDKLDEYILAHSSPEPPHLQRLSRKVNTRLLYSRMCSGHLQGRILKMLTTMINPLNVLELGTYAGYSALCIAEGLLRDDARVTTIEVDDEMEDFIRQALASHPCGQKVNLIIGDALKIIPELADACWDMVYIDANKRHYTAYFQLLIDKIPSGGYIIADNTLWDGKVADLGPRPDPQTAGILEFNDVVAADPRLETVIVPLRDGLTIIRKK